MRTDEFLARLQRVHDGKELVDLLIAAAAVAPPMKCSFPPLSGTTLVCMNNTPFIPAGTRGVPIEWHDSTGGFWGAITRKNLETAKIARYTIRWSTGKEEEIDKQTHDQYGFVYGY